MLKPKFVRVATGLYRDTDSGWTIETPLMRRRGHPSKDFIIKDGTGHEMTSADNFPDAESVATRFLEALRTE